MQELLTLAKKAARIAGDEIIDIKYPLINTKPDGTLVSSADLKANEIIFDILGKSKINICSEEQILDYEKRKKTLFWLIDPLDGTNNYLKNRKNFCVCISLIEDTRPILGVIYDVCNKNLYYSAKNMPVYKNQEILNKVRKESNKALVSLRKEQDINNSKIPFSYGYSALNIGSALKFCALLEGDADVYLRYERLNSWDLAAGDFLINQSGGLMLGLDKQKLNYNTPNFSCKPFIAFSSVFNKD
ncbi:3'(2'),5'-bisphosphate nucleotidase CysQ [Campylobacter sp. 2018MI13]|uniref:3'(2'),5'-bisphosphate nucleotidase CysQ n=1 Tax=Campylobacter sp. 2018MI13 TaxID=2836737 RepID=UPI001BD9B3DA|nr:3'(2'),5'-bisphosphate nucleotidase CysQ [Campylobacter sp. 2018MI13]MBT0882790.1 3'(2'),5'-bisphosphate nucleotidase CysQ [Campylobacter sp. 2018MI13]